MKFREIKPEEMARMKEKAAKGKSRRAANQERKAESIQKMYSKKATQKNAGGSMKESSTRGTPEQAKRAYESEKAKMKEFNEYMDYVESQLSDNRGGKKR